MIYEYREGFFIVFSKVRWICMSDVTMVVDLEYDHGESRRIRFDEKSYKKFERAWRSYARETVRIGTKIGKTTPESGVL